MDFLRRGVNDQPVARNNGTGQGPVAGFPSEPGAQNKINNKKNGGMMPGWLRAGFTILLGLAVVLVIASSAMLLLGKSKEASMVDNKAVQAVFLTNGQVYFGKVKYLDAQFVKLQDIYYLNSSNSESTTEDSKNPNLSLVKLGCELHGPADVMVINRDQVSFWENLKSDGKVAKAIAEWRTQNPNGQKCTDTTNSTQQSSTTNTSTTATNPTN